MTLDTRVYVLDEIAYKDVWLKCNQAAQQALSRALSARDVDRALQDPQRRRRPPMAIEIDDTEGRMSSDECDTVAVRRPDGGWTITGRPGVYDRNQAITAMTIAELLATGDEPDSPLVQTLEAELGEVSQ